MGKVISLHDFRLKKALTGIAEVYCNDPAIFQQYMDTMDVHTDLQVLMDFDAEVARLDDLIWATPGRIDFVLLEEKAKVIQDRLALVKKMNERGS